jgi:ubiquitin carboxyl-terminal hydrolase 4/11/15
MNSALQCLSNCEDLTKYFLTKKVFDEINRNNSHGTGGEVAKAWYELLKELWQGDSYYLCPTNFRQIFVRFVRQFAGFSQHDSHEMLTFMLDALHEDLNRVKQKPYCEMQEKAEQETDLQASSRWWKNHLSRENSIIVDLFHGQYKSVITCPQCNRISITYDPFMYLGLPIPAGHYKIKFKFFPYLNEIALKNYIFEYELPVNSNTSLKDMKLKILLSKQGINFDFLEGVMLNKDKQFKKIVKDEDLILPLFESGNEVVIYEKYPNIIGNEGKLNDFVSFYIHPSEVTEERNMMFFKKTFLKNISYPTVLTLKKTNTLGDLYYYIYRSYRKVFNLNSSLEEYYKNMNNRDEKKMQVDFEANFTREEPFKLHIINNLPEASGFFSSKQSCEFCGNKCETCPLMNSMKTSINSLLNKLLVQRPFLISLEIMKLNKSEKLFENLNFTPSSNKLVSKQSEIDIYDCLNLFRSEERLEKDNSWYCSKCKDHQEAFKRLEIYKPPNYLIVQFKRFKIKSNSTVMGMLSNRKIETHIEYPEVGLDLREYVVGPEKNEAIYDLCGISQHFGGLSSGHYTALCKNFGKWYEYDDDRVSKTSQADVVNSSAYMLFYRKR